MASDLPSEAARQAAREFLASVQESNIHDALAEHLTTFAAARVEKAVAAERERIESLSKQLEGYRNEREEEHAALRRRRIRFVRFNGVLEAIRLDDDVPDFQPDEPTTKGHGDE